MEALLSHRHRPVVPVLDAACRHLLGQPLLLASLPGLWCGDPDQRGEVRAAPEPDGV